MDSSDKYLETPEEFAKKEGFFDSPHFPMNHVAGLMDRYAKLYHQEQLNKKMPTDEEIKAYAKEESSSGNPYRQYDSIQLGAKWAISTLKS